MEFGGEALIPLKVLPTALANDADYLARFQREAQALAVLHHPNIVIELVEGETLRGPLPLAEAPPVLRWPGNSEGRHRVEIKLFSESRNPAAIPQPEFLAGSNI